MEQKERLERLTRELARERGIVQIPTDERELRQVFRGLRNLRLPGPISPQWQKLQDEFLLAEREEKGVMEALTLPVLAAYPNIALWQGDITRLRVDAIVNAANSALLGCFYPCHGCIDNAIHSAAGLQLREKCAQIMGGRKEKTGEAKITKGYNLPAKYVLHTVGPIVHGDVTEQDRRELASCYRSCLKLAAEHGLESVAFCCISTGEFRFPNQEAAEIAVETVRKFLKKRTCVQRVVFNVFKDVDRDIYRRLLGPDREAEKGGEGM